MGFMHFRNILPALIFATVLHSPLASAATLNADVENETCVASNTDSSPVVQFWEDLEADVRATRIAELEAQDPEISAAIASFVAKDPAAPTATEIQTRLDALNSGEGLAMLIPEDSTDPTLAVATEDFKTTYTYDEARGVIDGISEDPAAKVLSQLEDAATTRIAEIRVEKFSAQTAQYNDTQEALKADFQACVDAIDEARPIPLQYLILGGAGALAAVALGLRAWSNSRKNARHTR